MVVAAGLAVYPLTHAGTLAIAIVPLGAAAFGLIVLIALYRLNVVLLGLLPLAAEYLTAETTGRCGAISIVFYAVGLITLAELLFWSAELSREDEVERAVSSRRLLALAVIAITSALISLVTLAGSLLQLRTAFAAALVGSAAAVALLAIPWLLLQAWRER